MSEMRAARYDRYGPPEVLYEGIAPRPGAGPGEVLVRVHASSVNGGELLGRAGRVRVVTDLVKPRGFPKGVGIDFTGEVEALGRGVSDLAIGDRVWGALPRRFGSAAEFVAVAAQRVALAPAGLDLVRAAALPVGTNVITALRDKARLAPGERLLVRGASGGVGSIAVQLGRAYGAHVTALASAGNLDAVRGLGAEAVFDYSTTPPTGLGPFDVVFDTVGTRLGEFRRLLAPKGRMVTIAFDIDRAFSSIMTIVASTASGSRRIRFFSGNPSRRLFADLTDLVERGAIGPVVDTVYPLADIAAAHRRLETGGVLGKLIIRIA
jgi:NADPH:quinone reductase-like Zn-dependent oxidoreductase